MNATAFQGTVGELIAVTSSSKWGTRELTPEKAADSALSVNAKIIADELGDKILAFSDKIRQRMVFIENVATYEQLSYIVRELEYVTDIKHVYIRSFSSDEKTGLISVEASQAGFDRLSDRLMELKIVSLDILEDQRFLIKVKIR